MFIAYLTVCTVRSLRVTVTINKVLSYLILFSDFLRTYYCDFLKNVYREGSVFSCGMGNGKHVLPVLHCLKRVIAFVSSFKEK